MTLDNLLQTIAHVSKDDNKRLIHYVQQVPQDFNYYNTNGRRSENVVLLHNALVWACRNNMKLGSEISVHTFSTSFESLFAFAAVFQYYSDAYTQDRFS